MHLVIGNFPPATSKDDVADLLQNHFGATAPADISISEGGGVALIALVHFSKDEPHTLYDVLADKLNGFHYKGRDLNANVTHNFKD